MSLAEAELEYHYPAPYVNAGEKEEPMDKVSIMSAQRSGRRLTPLLTFHSVP